MTADIAVIDYGMGNLRSVAKALEHVAPAANVIVTADPEAILSVVGSYFLAWVQWVTAWRN